MTCNWTERRREGIGPSEYSRFAQEGTWFTGLKHDSRTSRFTGRMQLAMRHQQELCYIDEAGGKSSQDRVITTTALNKTTNKLTSSDLMHSRSKSLCTTLLLCIIKVSLSKERPVLSHLLGCGCRRLCTREVAWQAAITIDKGAESKENELYRWKASLRNLKHLKQH
jgi:hypothetical protein